MAVRSSASGVHAYTSIQEHPTELMAAPGELCSQDLSGITSFICHTLLRDRCSFEHNQFWA